MATVAENERGSSLMAVTRVVWRPAVEKLKALMTEQLEYGFGLFHQGQSSLLSPSPLWLH